MASAANATNIKGDGHIALPSPVLYSHYIATCVSLLAVASLMVGLKFAFTWKARGKFGMDDVMIFLGLVTLIAAGAVGGETYNHGLGKPVELIDGEFMPWIGYWWEYVFYTVWFLPLCFSKLAFFFMYTRTFQGRKLRWTLYVSMFLFAGTTILFMTGSMLMNDGIKQSRFEAIKALRYHVQFKYLHYAWGTCDILADLWICLLPLFGLRVLNIGIRRRLWLTLKFAVPAITLVISMFRIFELNLVMSRDIVEDQTWDPYLAETVPMLWAFIQAAASMIITTLPSLALRISQCWKARHATTPEATPEQAQRLTETQRLSGTTEGGISQSDTGESSPATITSSGPTSSTFSKLSKADKILGVGQRFKRSKTPDEYTEEAHRLEHISGITVTRTVNVTSALDPEEGFKYMYRKYCGQA